MAAANTSRIPTPFETSQFDYATVMNQQLQATTRGMEVLTRSTPEEVVKFVTGCRMASEALLRDEADVVLVPERGAYPMAFIAQAFMRAQGAPGPEFVSLPLGTNVGSDLKERGIEQAQKARIIETTFDYLTDARLYRPGVTKLALIDEVQRGGTISTATELILASCENRGDANPLLTVVALTDDRLPQGTARTDKFKQLASNTTRHTHVTTLPLPLIGADRSPLLNAIVDGNNPGVAADQWDPARLQIARNQEAAAIFGALAHAYLNPRQALEEIEAIRSRGSERILDLGTAAVQAVLLEAATDPRQILHRRHEYFIMDWWKQYCLAVLEHQRTSGRV